MSSRTGSWLYRVATSPQRMTRAVRGVVIVGVIAGVVAGSVLVATVHAQKADGARKLTSVSLQLDFIKNIQFAGILVGLDRGFYRDEGINLSVTAQGPTTDPVSLVASGHTTIGMNSGDVLIQARAKGIPVKAFAADLQINPAGWLVLKSSGIKTLKDFKHKTLGIPAAYRNQAALVLSLEGLTKDDVTLRTVGFDVSVLVNHEVDVFNAFATNQPITLSLKGIPNKFFRWYDSGYVYYTDAFFVTDKTLKSKGALLRSFVKATQRGWAYVYAHPKEAVNFVVKKYGAGLLDSKQQLAELKQLKPLMNTTDTATNGFGHMKTQQWQRGINLFAKFHLIDHGFPANQIFAQGFVQK